MKKIINALEKQLKQIRDKVSNREDYALNRSEKWQESEKGEQYEDATYELDEKADDLESLIDELKELGI